MGFMDAKAAGGDGVVDGDGVLGGDGMSVACDEVRVVSWVRLDLLSTGMEMDDGGSVGGEGWLDGFLAERRLVFLGGVGDTTEANLDSF